MAGGDRRRPAKVEFTDGNGRKSTAYNLTINRSQAILASLAALVAIGISIGSVSCAGVRFGLTTTIHDAIDKSIAAPNGVIHRHMCEVAKSYDRDLEKQVLEEIDQVENAVIELKTQQGELVKAIDRMGDRVHRRDPP